MDTSFFDSFPTLETRRLLLRQLAGPDASALFEMFSDEEVTRFYDVETMHDIEAARAIIANLRSRFESQLGIRWAIVDKVDSSFLGSIGFNSINAYAHRAVVGYDIARRAWGQGFATEALGEVVRFGHHTIGLNRIEASVMQDNEASVRVLCKAGFEEEGTLRAYGYWKGRYHDLRMFSIVRET